MKSHDKILMSLPESFTRQQFLEVAGSETAFSLSHCQNLLSEAIFQKDIERTSRGEYRKVNQSELEFEQA